MDVLTEKERRCPGCGARLGRVRAEASYRRIIVLDQCPRCGGVWFDRWELYLLDDGAAESLEKVDEGLFLGRVPARKGSGECPVCAVPLVRFADPNLPPDSSIKRCGACGGLWLRRGEIGSYASYRRAVREKRGLVRGQPRGSPAPRGAETLDRLGAAVDASSLTRVRAPVDDGPLDVREFAKDAAVIILQALLRLVFRF